MTTHTAGRTGLRSPGINTKLPVTKPGKWAMWLLAAFVVMMALNAAFVGIFGTTTNQALDEFSRTYMPYWAIALMLVGATSGVVALVAMIAKKERSIVTLISLAPLAFVIMLLLGELLVPH
jgi:uncharacterized membrane protein YjfL (UPF0719 family)